MSTGRILYILFCKICCQARVITIFLRSFVFLLVLNLLTFISRDLRPLTFHQAVILASMYLIPSTICPSLRLCYLLYNYHFLNFHDSFFFLFSFLFRLGFLSENIFCYFCLLEFSLPNNLFCCKDVLLFRLVKLSTNWC